jgi:hypothetical protein
MTRDDVERRRPMDPVAPSSTTLRVMAASLRRSRLRQREERGQGDGGIAARSASMRSSTPP